MATTSNSAASEDQSLIQTRPGVDNWTASMQTMQPRLPTRSPSTKSFDWFNEYVDYSELINGSPITPTNPLMETLLRFQKRLENYEKERAYKAFFESIYVEHSCNTCRIVRAMDQLRHSLEYADEEMTPMEIENWAQATVEKAIQLKIGDNVILQVGHAVAQLHIALGKPWEAKLYLEQTIFEMERQNTPVDNRQEATLSLAKCYFKLGNIQRADKLLKVIFKTEYPKIGALSYLFLENYCGDHQIELLKRFYSDTEDDSAPNVNDIVEYGWEKNDRVREIWVNAAKFVRELNPRIIKETGGCDVEGFRCQWVMIGESDDESDDELDRDMQSDE